MINKFHIIFGAEWNILFILKVKRLSELFSDRIGSPNYVDDYCVLNDQ